MADVTAPVADFTGEVVGVSFKDGKGSTTDPKALAYFRRHGYGVDSPTPESPDPRKVGFLGSGIEQVGTHLRDAAVDPRPSDYLPPTNAGEANPHGPEVVSPEIHGSEGVRPIRGGPVPTEPAVQEAAETSHAAEVTEVEPSTERPAKSASKAEWVAYAVSQGDDPDEAEAASKAALIERHGGEA